MPMCGNKIQHATRDDALEHIKRLLWQNDVRGQQDRSAGLQPYPCDECGAWHVGHRADSPLVYHYTTMPYLDPILESDELRPAKPRFVPRKVLRQVPQDARVHLQQLSEQAPLLWFSRNKEWEYSVDKRMNKTIGRAQTEVLDGGLLRFAVPASFAKLRWYDYIVRNKVSTSVRRMMTQRGDPNDWLATDEPVPLKYVRAIEVYMYRWLPVADVDDDLFARYIRGRRREYDVAWESMKHKVAEARKTGRATENPNEVEVCLSFTEAEYILYTDAKRRENTSGLENPAFLRTVLQDYRE
jgi:hypothetical protein